jgi:septum formation protein
MEPIILASGSPRRQEYFRLLGLPFSIMPSYIDETPRGNFGAKEFTEDLSIRKVKKVIEILRGRIPSWICGVDTVISLDGDILGKPEDRDKAKNMLLRLRGRNHEVITAIALFKGKEQSIDCRSISSTVTFASLSEEEVEWYLNTGEWQGTAGAYQVQGLAGCFVSAIKGSYSGVVGLPIREFYVMLRENGYPYGAF